MAGETNRNIIGRGSFWTAAAFYVLIGFEFLYMAGPFAALFYSVYRPGLNFFGDNPPFSWLTRFFMPHIAAETTSPLIDLHNAIGAVLAVLGFAAFCVGAAQVYYHKLAKKGAVTGGAYRFIRHPQYAAFIVCGFGLLLLWPRYLVLVIFTTMLFGYYWLARIEESECERKYGQPYREYKERTSMFVPLPLPVKRLFPFPGSGWKRKATLAVLYAVVLGGGMTGARILESRSLHSLYTYTTADSVTISVVKAAPETLRAIMATALASEDVQDRLKKSGPKGPLLNYVLPADWFISEVPMNDKEGAGDSQPGDYHRGLYKVIFTRAGMRGPYREGVEGFLQRVAKRTPLAEAWIDMTGPRVTRVKDPPAAARYENIPVALY